MPLLFRIHKSSPKKLVTRPFQYAEIIDGGDVALRAVSCSLGLSGGASDGDIGCYHGIEGNRTYVLQI